MSRPCDDREVERLLARALQGAAPGDAEEARAMAGFGLEESPREAAEREIREAQEAQLEARISARASELQRQRQREAEDRKREEERAAWRAKADELGGQLFEDLQRAEQKMDELVEILEAASEKERQRLEARRRAGTPVLETAPLDSSFPGWAEARIGARFLPGGRAAYGSYGLASLAERAGLAKP